METKNLFYYCDNHNLPTR